LLDAAETALAAGVAARGGASKGGLLWRKGIISASTGKKLLHMIKRSLSSASMFRPWPSLTPNLFLNVRRVVPRAAGVHAQVFDG
jgi:hypothetical protein